MTKAGCRLAISSLMLAASGHACTQPTFSNRGLAEHDAAITSEPEMADGDAKDEQGEEDASSDPARPSEPDDGATSVDASVRTDAGVGDVVSGGEAGITASQDAGPPPTMQHNDAGSAGSLPEWAQALIGTYAKRSVSFSYDAQSNPPNTRNIEDSILTIEQDGAGLRAKVQLCHYEVQLTGWRPLSFKYAFVIPPVKAPILLGADNTFSSEPMTQQLGFDPARNDCQGSVGRSRYIDQTWNTGPTCTCASTRVPTTLNDCRLTDADGDNRAGITATAQVVPFADLSDVVMVFQQSVTLVEGHVVANKNHTLKELRTQDQACLDNAHDLCSFGATQLCPSTVTTKLIFQSQASCGTFPDAAFGALPEYPANPKCL